MISKSFILAGKAIFTIEPSPKFIAQHSKPKPLPGGSVLLACKSHYTYKVVPCEDNQEIYFAHLLRGPDNEKDYSFLGTVRVDGGELFAGKDNKIRELTHAFRILRRVLIAIWQGNESKIEANGWKINHAGKCGRCGRTLTTPESLESGIGPECRGKVACGGLGTGKKVEVKSEPETTVTK